MLNNTSFLNNKKNKYPPVIAGGYFLCGQSPLLPAARAASCWYGLIAVKSLLLDARKRVSLVVTYYQPLSCFIFLRLLLDILLNLFCIFPCCIHAISPILPCVKTPYQSSVPYIKRIRLYTQYPPALKLPYQAYVSILSTSGYTCNILCAGILVPVFCISVRLIAHLSLYCYSL